MKRVPLVDDRPDNHDDAMYRRLEDKTRQLEESNRELLLEIFERGRLAQVQSAILNAVPAQIALLDSAGVIVTVNDAWRRFSALNVLAAPDCGVGQPYLDVCEGGAGRVPRARHVSQRE